VPPGTALDALTAADVAVAGESILGDELERLARDGGLSQVARVSLAKTSAGRDLLVCAPTPKEVDALRRVNEARLANGGPWLPVLPYDGRSLVIGPLVLPNESACHACYRLRRASASGYEEDFDLLDRTPTRAARTAALRAVAAGLAATVALRWLSVRDATLPGRCYVLETGSVLALSFHRVLRVPRCPACGPGDASIPSPWFKETARDG
jgi:bacteriocin biosynthesis cyclodehydratase domain-containing protein